MIPLKHTRPLITGPLNIYIYIFILNEHTQTHTHVERM